MSTRKIYSISEFLAQLDEISSSHINNMIYRGESKKNEIPLLASAFRPGYNFKHEQMQKVFYNETINTLSDPQKDNFMAFAQHHGIPTCLLDFTLNPLVALFFACSGNLNSDGFVYLLNNNTIDITNFVDYSRPSILNRLYKGSENFDELFSKIPLSHEDEKVIIKKLYTYFKDSKYYNSYEISICMRNLINIYKENIGVDLELIEYVQFRKDSKELWLEILGLLTDFFDEANEDISDILQRYGTNERNLYITVILISIFASIKINRRKLIRHDEKKFAFYEQPFLFSYSPPNVGERINNQSSIFIYQNYLRGEILKTISAVQRIKADYIIEVPKKCKNAVLNSLDTLGINEKFIYGGYDNIANAIKSRYHIHT